MPFTRSDFATTTGVSRETLALYEKWFALLRKWNAKINLVAPNTLDEFWDRHALDSHQLIDLIPPETKSILDMGAGAGFPGIAMAIESVGTTRQITLCETNGKKANFLRAVIRELNLPAQVAQTRVETMPIPVSDKGGVRGFDLITARAFASLPNLLAHSLRFWGPRTQTIFPKGEHWQDEINAAKLSYGFDLITHDSQTNPAAKILTITNLSTL